MDEIEYAKQMAEIQENEEPQTPQHEVEKQTDKPEKFPTSSQDQRVSSDEIDDLIKKTEAIKTPGEIEEKLEHDEEIHKQELKSNEELKNMTSLRDFMKTEEFLRLGTKARIPVALDLNGFKVKVFVRALSRNEIQACRVQANNTDDDMDFLAVTKACTDEYGEPFSREVLDQLGYARIRDISEAIGIASGESPDNTESAIRKQVIDNFLQKIEDET